MKRFAPKEALLALIRLYQKTRPKSTAGCCKYIPTCSEYGLVAIERFGVLKGGLLTLWRILRCNPFSKGGFDPVPEKKDR
ncbi:MAG: membrane protein insertion efficiency factor YidD [Clostridia bacterium]|nr:membrane protein insertion efficiency factor YidD [Clostridia bacterium]